MHYSTYYKTSLRWCGEKIIEVYCHKRIVFAYIWRCTKRCTSSCPRGAHAELVIFLKDENHIWKFKVGIVERTTVQLCHNLPIYLFSFQIITVFQYNYHIMPPGRRRNIDSMSADQGAIKSNKKARTAAYSK